VTNAFGDDPEGATPLDDEQMDGLRPSWVATRADLNVAEEQNIAAATEWALLRKWTPAQLLTESALLGLHRRMFAEVWTWAGTWRRADTNIGADWHFIRVQLRQLVDDTGVGSNTAPTPTMKSLFVFITSSSPSIPSRMATADMRDLPPISWRSV